MSGLSTIVAMIFEWGAVLKVWTAWGGSLSTENSHFCTTYVVDATMMSKGIDQCMKRVNHVDTIWSRVKDGALVPFLLQIRLTDEAQFMGHLSIVDLQQPEFRQPLVLQPAASIYCSFEQLSKYYYDVFCPRHE